VTECSGDIEGFIWARLEFKTPEEMFSGKKPEVSYLKILVAQYSYIFQKRRETSWTPQERREYLWDTVRLPRPSGFIYQVTIILRSAGM
jgi:hypothetical protein